MLTKSFLAAALLALLPLSEPRQRAEGAITYVAAQDAAPALSDSAFAALVARISEPGGYFDSDNLISNESSYLHVLGAMRRIGVAGGAYVGVGPDQNFSYMAQVRPRVAFIVDIRRDNLLQHLLFKALFEMSRNRVEYLALLTGRAVPNDVAKWNRRPITEIVDFIDKSAPDPDQFETTRGTVRTKIRRYGVPVTPAELETISHIQQAFFDAGLDLKFTSLGRAPREYYPNLRKLLLEKDLTGKQANYLASEDDFQYVKSLEARNLVIPVVGNLAGPHALREIGRVMTERGEKLSVLYVSNVEFYLMREGTFDAFAASVRTLPYNAHSVIIRSYFGGGFYGSHPQGVPGYFSTQLLQTVDSFAQEAARGGYATYNDLVYKHNEQLK
ncbi:MAG TPA: hypothetical protein VL308_03340 [Gemmatimonadaceae bacterium]|nr:hypothetical protein [Gemmatimonadaceae bacterium]